VPKGYIVISEKVHDEDGMNRYSAAAFPTIMGNAEVLIVDPQPEVLEGEWDATQTVVLEFESVEAARDWYRSEAYQEAVPLRQAAADCNVVILSGFG
jgi:uncharacterized protein (DUF1330 family)